MLAHGQQLGDDGTVARLPELIEFRKRFGLKLISIADLIGEAISRTATEESVSSLFD